MSFSTAMEYHKNQGRGSASFTTDRGIPPHSKTA